MGGEGGGVEGREAVNTVGNDGSKNSHATRYPETTLNFHQ